MNFNYQFFRDMLKGDGIIWTVYILLSIISIFEVFSAGSSLSFETGDYYTPIKHHSITLALGAMVVWMVHHIPLKFFRLIPFIFLPLSFVLLLTLTIMGMIDENRINDASRWIFGFQPSEMAKMAVVVTVAYLLAHYQREDGCASEAFKPVLLTSGVIILLIAPENGSTALLLSAVVYMMMLVGRIPGRQMLKLTLTVLVGASLLLTALVTVPPKVYKDVPGTHRFVTWRNRIIEFFNEEEVPAAKFDIDKKAQVAHANIAIATSHIIGKGPGNSVQRDHLSHGYSDFIYAITVEETGLLGGAFVVMLYIILVFRAGRIAKRCDKYFPAFLVIGVTLLLVSQAMLHMMVSVGLFPVTGQPLPLVSKGGTSILFNCVYIGILLSVSRYVLEHDTDSNTESGEPATTDIQHHT